MGALKGFAAVILLAGPVPAASKSGGRFAISAPDRPDGREKDRWTSFIREASERFGIPEAWIRRVIRAESAGRTRLGGRPITSRAGAMGLMQLMPGTWAEMRSKYKLGPDPHDPRDNILAGTAYLRAMYDRFGYPGLFGAYNAGPGRYEAHLAGRASLPAETVAYLAALGSDGPGKFREPVTKIRGGNLFFRLSNASPGNSHRADPGPASRRSDPELFMSLESLSAPRQ